MITIKQAWPDGPRREFSDQRESGRFIPYRNKDLGAFAGSYCCDKCDAVAHAGVYRIADAQKWGFSAAVIWACAECKKQLKPKRVQPEGLRKHNAGQRV